MVHRIFPGVRALKYYIDLLNELEKGKIAPVYLFYGPEVYLQEKAMERFREKLLPPQADFNLDILDGEEAGEGDIVSRAQTPPFLAGRRLVLVRHAPFFSGGDKGEKKERAGSSSRHKSPAGEKDSPLRAYLKQPVPHTCVIFTTTGPVDQRRRLFKALKEKGRVVEFTFLKARDLVRWLEKEARLAGKTIAPAAAELLVQRVGNSLFILKNELEKAIAYAGERKEIREEDIRRLTVPLVEENIFQVVDAIGQRHVTSALAGIRELLAKGQPGPAILAMVARQFRLILQGQELMGKAGPGEDLAGLLGVHPFVARKVLAQMHNFTRDQVLVILNKLLELDRGIKRGRMEFYPGMEMLLLEWGVSRSHLISRNTKKPPC